MPSESVICILYVGVSEEKFNLFNLIIRSVASVTSLRLAAVRRETFSDAADFISTNRRVGLVFIGNDFSIPEDELTAECEQLATVIARQPQRSQVVTYDQRMTRLHKIFRGAGVEVSSEPVLMAVERTFRTA